jgi:hypothetical protein
MLFFSVIFFAACKKDSVVNEPNPVEGLAKLAEGYAAGAAVKIEIYTKEKTITSGYTKLYVALYDSMSGKPIQHANVKLMPMMDMGTMKHSAPYENPSSAVAVNKLYPCAVMFIMSSVGGSWTVDISIQNHNSGKHGTLTIPVTVSEPAKARMKSFIAKHDGAKYFVSLVEPSAPKVGMNELEIAIYKKETMMSFPADSSLSVSFEPEMPTMGHGSPNNVNPVHVNKGHYKGKVNFTMTGLWRLNFDFTCNGAEADLTQFIDLEF